MVLKTVTEATDLSKATDEKLQKILKDLNTLVRYALAIHTYSMYIHNT